MNISPSTHKLSAIKPEYFISRDSEGNSLRTMSMDTITVKIENNCVHKTVSYEDFF